MFRPMIQSQDLKLDFVGFFINRVDTNRLYLFVNVFEMTN